MASWLQAQLKAAENLLEAVDRTVSATTGAAAAPGPTTPAGEHDQGALPSNPAWQQLPATAQGPSSQYGSPQKGSSSPLLAANVSRGLLWLQGSPQPSGSPATGSPAHPAAAAAARQQQPGQQQLWQPFVPQPPGPSGTDPGPRCGAHSSPAPGGSPAHSSLRASPAATPPSSTGGYTTKSRGPFSSGGGSSLQPVGGDSSSSSSSTQVPQPGLPGPPLMPAAQQAWQPAETSSAPANSDVGPMFEAAQQPAAAAASTPVDSLPAAADQEQAPLSSAGLPAGTAPAPAASAVPEQPPEQLEVSSSTAPASAPPAAEASAGPAFAPEEAAAVAAGPALSSVTGSTDEQQHQQQEQQQLFSEQHDSSGPAASWDEAAAAAADAAAADRGSSTSTGGAPAATADVDSTAAAAAAAEASISSSRAGSDHLAAPGAAAAAEPSSSDGGAAAAVPGPAAPAAAASATAATAAAAAAAAAAAGGGSSSSAKESQLTRLVETLRKRLEVVRGENQQLEDMLHEAEQRSSAEQATIAQLTAELTAVRREQDGLVSSAAANAAAQDAHIGRLQAELEASSRQVSALQAELQAAQEQHAQALSSKDSMEGGALEALRAEVSTYEGQLEAERRAHAATKAAAASRERDLEEQLGSSSEALAAIQRQLEDASSRAREAEQQQLLAAAEAARLQQQVQQLGLEQSPGHQPDPHLLLQQEAEREALQRRTAEAEAQAAAALQAQRAAEGRVAELQGEVAHLHSSYQAQAANRGAPQLEQQLRELQDLLYQKQQQLERLSGEKQAQQLMLERQITSLKSELGKAHAAAAAASVSGLHMRSSHDIIPMDALGEPYQRLARHNKLGGAVQATANFLDTTAASASQLLRQQPLARLIVFLYIVLIHLYVYFLLARMQRQALMLVAQQDHSAGVGPELQLPGQQAPPAPVLAPPMPAAGGAQP